MYLLHLFSMYRIECLEEIYPQLCFDLMKKIINFRVDTIKNQVIKNLSSYNSKSHASVIFVVPRSPFLEKDWRQPFIHFSIVFCFYTVLHNRWSLYTILQKAMVQWLSWLEMNSVTQLVWIPPGAVVNVRDNDIAVS